MNPHTFTEIGRVIQLSLAPVFLITGIAGILNVLSNRLGRTIDRARLVHALPESDQVANELLVLSRRAKLIYRAIAFGVSSALLISFIIVALFISAFVSFPIGVVIAVLFVAAVIALIAALILFLREVFLGTSALRIHRR